MATTVLEVKTADGKFASFDIDTIPAKGPQRVSKDGEVVARLEEPLDKALASARPAAESIIDAFKELSPDETTVEFGLRLDAQDSGAAAR